jgi:hypothetical protein
MIRTIVFLDHRTLDYRDHAQPGRRLRSGGHDPIEDAIRRYFELLCLLLAAQGLGWALVGSFDPFGVWDGLAAASLYGAARLPPEALPLARLLLVLLGATDAGFFVLLYFLVRHGVAAGLSWAHRAAVYGVATWCLVDTIGSACLGAWFNVVLVNLPASILLAVPLWSLRPGRASPWLGSPGS